MKKILMVFVGATLMAVSQAGAQSSTDTAHVFKLGAKAPVAMPHPAKKASGSVSTSRANDTQLNPIASAATARKVAPMTLQSDSTRAHAATAKPAPRAAGKMRASAPPK